MNATNRKRLDRFCACTEDVVDLELYCRLPVVRCMGCGVVRILTMDERKRVAGALFDG